MPRCCGKRGFRSLLPRKTRSAAQAAGSSWGVCSPSPTCCAVRACGTCKCIMIEMKGQGRTTAHGRVGLNFAPGEGQPGLLLQQCMVVVSIILTGLEQPHPFKGCLDHVGTKIMLTLPWHRTCHLAWLVLTHCSKKKKKKITSTYITPGRHFSNQISGKGNSQRLQVLQWFSIPAIRKLFPANDS